MDLNTLEQIGLAFVCGYTARKVMEEDDTEELEVNKNNIEMIGILHEYSRVKKHMMFQAKLVISQFMSNDKYGNSYYKVLKHLEVVEFGMQLLI